MPDSVRNNRRSGRRGVSLVIALALILALTVLVAATQLQVVSQLEVTRTERDYEHALQAAEAGVNIYLNQLARGVATGGITEVSIPQFRAGVLNGTIPITRYPAGSQQGYYVGYIGNLSASITVLSYGWSHGVVRRLKVGGRAQSYFSTASVYALNPSLTSTGALDTSTQNYSWSMSGSANSIGSCGALGRIDYSNNNTFYDGPVSLVGPYARFGSGINPPVLQSGPNVPGGHTGTGTLANPSVQRVSTVGHIPSADEAANTASGTTQGVEYFRNNNNNATGLRYLVQNSSTGAIRELSGSYTVLTPGTYVLSNQLSPSSSTLHGIGMGSGESYYGLRIYPGNYFFEQIKQTTSQLISLRSYSDDERATLGFSSQPANPNPGQASNSNVRLWIGHVASGTDPQTSFSYQCFMDYTPYASRWRVYLASNGGVSISGTNQNPPPPFRVNLLNYNRTSAGAGYGTTTLSSSVYLFGSLIGWQVSIGGGSTIEKQQSELSLVDVGNFLVTDWREVE